MKPCKAKTITSWILQLIAAVILFQTLFFKFTGAEESKYIFQTLVFRPRTSREKSGQSWRSLEISARGGLLHQG